MPMAPRNHAHHKTPATSQNCILFTSPTTSNNYGASLDSAEGAEHFLTILGHLKHVQVLHEQAWKVQSGSTL